MAKTIIIVCDTFHPSFIMISEIVVKTLLLPINRNCLEKHR